MKLEPVYLVAPKPRPKSIPTRRAFVLAAACGIGGVAIGSIGTWIAIVQSPAEPQAPEDPTLRWLRDLCRSAPIDQLLQHRAVLYQQLPMHIRDADLWLGVERIATNLLENALVADRRRLAIELTALLDHMTFPPALVQWDLEQLRRVAKER